MCEAHSKYSIFNLLCIFTIENIAKIKYKLYFSFDIFNMQKLFASFMGERVKRKFLKLDQNCILSAFLNFTSLFLIYNKFTYCFFLFQKINFLLFLFIPYGALWKISNSSHMKPLSASFCAKRRKIFLIRKTFTKNSPPLCLNSRDLKFELWFS